MLITCQLFSAASRYEIFLLVFQAIKYAFKIMVEKVLSVFDHFFLSSRRCVVA